MKFVSLKKLPKIDANWFDKESDTTIIISDGDPGFKIDLGKKLKNGRKQPTSQVYSTD